MNKEIEVAVNWWADQLKQKPKFDNGDSMHSAMFSLIKVEPLSEKQIEDFKDSLRDILTESFAENWNPDEPKFGAYFRCIGVDYGPDRKLRDASLKAGFDIENRFPVKTDMWVDPGKVEVSCGYRAPVEVLYSAGGDDEA